MPFISIRIDKVITQDNDKIIELLEEILSIVKEGDGEELRQEIADKLDKAISDIKSTIQN